jgi:hypothetical protein
MDILAMVPCYSVCRARAEVAWLRSGRRWAHRGERGLVGCVSIEVQHSQEQIGGRKMYVLIPIAKLVGRQLLRACDAGGDPEYALCHDRVSYYA